MNVNVTEVDYEILKNQILEKDNWVILSTVNFEECSVFFTSDLIKSLTPQDSQRIKFLPIKLTSKRATPWSTLEIVKNDFETELMDSAKAKKIDFKTTSIEYPAGREIVSKTLLQSKALFPSRANLVIDISSMPREMATYFCDYVCGILDTKLILNFEHVFILVTPPQRVTSRNGLDPSQLANQNAFITIAFQIH